MKLYDEQGRLVVVTSAGAGGDMYKSTYDTDDDGVVDNSEQLEGSTKAQVQDHDPKAHASSHQNGGADELDLAGLSGELADPQPAKAHSLGGSEHNADTLANLNSKVSDATLDDSADPRDPNAHKTTHENGGGDEISIAGLSGEAADPQTPKSHASTHANGGADEINVGGLSGLLADGQTPLAHKSSHQNGGTDEISVAGLSGELADGQKVKTDHVDKTHLSQDFGPSSARLGNLIISPVDGKVLSWAPSATHITSDSPFSAKINAAGSGGLTATNVPYDNETKEGMLEGLDDYDGTNYWGQIILHNTTRANSRKIVSVDTTNKVITTTSSTDDWSDDDDITVQSQTNTYSGYFDVDLSAKIPATTQAILCFGSWLDCEGNADSSRYAMYHTYESYDQGKRVWLCAYVAYEQNTMSWLLPVVSQKITLKFGPGCNGCGLALSVIGQMEYADT